MSKMNMSDFLGCVHELAGKNFKSSEVIPFLQSSLIASESLEKYLFWKDGGYTRNLVHKDETFELMVLCWDIGQKAAVHGHEGEKCFTRVERGKLFVHNYHEISRDGDRAVVEMTGKPYESIVGAVDGPADIHSVDNDARFNERAVSLHLYSHPYDECDLYDLETGIVTRRALSYDSIGGKQV